jgi:hypothetical protein
MRCTNISQYILFGLKSHFGDQKEWVKTISGHVLNQFCYYYGWIPWSDLKHNPLKGNVLHTMFEFEEL